MLTRARLALSITFFHLAARAAHLVFFLLLGNVYGVSASTDIVFLVYAPLAVVMSVFAAVADVTVMPSLHQAQRLHCVPAVISIIRQRALIVVSILSAILSSFLFLLLGTAHLWIVAILALVPVTNCLSAVYLHALNAHGHFKFAALAPLFGAGTAIAMLVALPFSSEALATSLLGYEVGTGAALWIFTRRIATRAEGVASPDAKKICASAFKTATVQSVGSLLVALNPLIGIWYAKGMAAGAVTMVEYASRLANVVPLLFSGSLILFYSNFSRAVSAGTASPSDLVLTARRLGLVALILAACAVMASPYIFNIIYGFGDMGPAERRTVADLFSFYMIGAAAYVSSLVYVRAISAMGKAEVLVRGAVLSVLATAVGTYVLGAFLQLNGIGLANSIAQILVAAYLYIAARKMVTLAPTTATEKMDSL